MGKEASPKEEGSAANLPMWDKETLALPPQGLQITTLPHAEFFCATDPPWRSFLPQF